MGYIQAGNAGYRWNEDNHTVYFFLPPMWKKISQYTNKRSLLEELKKREILALNEAGNPLESKSVRYDEHSSNKRGIGIIVKKVKDKFDRNDGNDIFSDLKLSSEIDISVGEVF